MIDAAFHGIFLYPVFVISFRRIMADALDRLCNDSSPAITARRPPGVWALDEGRAHPVGKSRWRSAENTGVRHPRHDCS
jgi:hypothetical protein